MKYGTSCWPWGNSAQCKTGVSAPTQEQLDVKMADEGWYIGDYNGQALPRLTTRTMSEAVNY